MKNKMLNCVIKYLCKQINTFLYLCLALLILFHNITQLVQMIVKIVTFSTVDYFYERSVSFAILQQIYLKMNSIIRTNFHNNKNLLKLLQPIIISLRTNTTDGTSETSDTISKKGGYAKAFDKFEAQLNEPQKKTIQNKSFAHLLRHSKFIDVCIHFFRSELLFNIVLYSVR